MSNTPSFRFPFTLPEDVHPQVASALRYCFNATADLNQAIEALVPKLAAGTITTKSNVAASSASQPSQTIGGVNQQPVGVATSYLTQQSDLGGLIVVTSPNPFTVNLNSGLLVPYVTAIQNLGSGVITLSATSGTVNGTSPSGGYDMLAWMLMSPSLRASNHFASTQLDGITPSNHLYTQQDSGKFYWIKGDSGFPWDIQIVDNDKIYFSTTELTYASPTEGKRFESLTPAIGFRGVPAANRFMNIGDVLLGLDSRLAIYTSCGVATYTQIGKTKFTLTGPYTETIPGAGSTLPAGLTTIHLEYEWSLDNSYNHQAGSTKETYTLCQPYGLVRWQTQNWNVGTASYDPPNQATNYNILTAGTTGLPASDPCPFGVNGTGGGGTGLISIEPGQMAVCYFDGVNWWVMAPLLAQSLVKLPSNWMDSYDATTGIFTQSQPRAEDLSNGTSGTGRVILDSGATLKFPTIDSGTLVQATFTGITRIIGLSIFANNAAAIAGGLVAGDLYRSGADPDAILVVH